MFVLGIDAGGTKTTICSVAADDGRIMRSARGAGANLISLGEHGVEVVLRDVVAQALADHAEPPAAVCLGMAESINLAKLMWSAAFWPGWASMVAS